LSRRGSEVFPARIDGEKKEKEHVTLTPDQCTLYPLREKGNRYRSCPCLEGRRRRGGNAYLYYESPQRKKGRETPPHRFSGEIAARKTEHLLVRRRGKRRRGGRTPGSVM